jgi:hypothetical protein
MGMWWRYLPLPAALVATRWNLPCGFRWEEERQVEEPRAMAAGGGARVWRNSGRRRSGGSERTGMLD